MAALCEQPIPNPALLTDKHAAVFQSASLVDLPDFACGNAQDAAAATGCTVVVAPQGATCGVAVRGGGPATRETDLLRPENTVQLVHAVVLSGGSAFGLAASTGVMDALAARGIGFELMGLHVPIVTGACLFDLAIGENAHPDAAMGARATQAALAGEPFSEGDVGAGCGATVGKMLAPEQAMKTGLGVYGLRLGQTVAVAVMAVNALGTVVDDAGVPLAGHLRRAGAPEAGILAPLQAVGQMAAGAAGQDADSASGEDAAAQGSQDSQGTQGSKGSPAPCTNTTIGCVLTNAALTKAQATKIASIAHDGYARAIRPVHSSNDGDALFAFASGQVEAPFDLVGALATEAVRGAIQRAATQSAGAHGAPAYRDVF